MTDLNLVTINGRLVKDADCGVTQGGNNAVRFSIASNTSRKGQDGNWTDEANYYDCMYYGNPGVNQYLTKGRQVTISGSLRQVRWEKDGQRFSRVCILAQQIFLNSQGGNSNTQQQSQARPAQKTDEEKLDEATKQWEQSRNRKSQQGQSDMLSDIDNIPF